MSVGIIAYYQQMQVCQVKVFISTLNIYWRCWISLYVNLGFFIQIPYSVLVALWGLFVIPFEFPPLLQNLAERMLRKTVCNSCSKIVLNGTYHSKWNYYLYEIQIPLFNEKGCDFYFFHDLQL